MNFVAVGDQAIALLRQRGRLTYRTLLVNLSPEDTQRCHEALAHVEAAGIFVMAEPFHCAVGTTL